MVWIRVSTLTLFLFIFGNRAVDGELQFVRKPLNATVAVGGNVSLACSAMDEGMQSVPVAWTNWNESTLPQRFHFSSETGTLELRPVQCVDTGWYTCRASSVGETIEVRIYLNIICSGHVPWFTRRLSSTYSFAPNRNSLIHCYSKGNPKPEIHWYSRGVRLPLSAPTGGGPFASSNVVSFEFATAADSDTYQCVSSNAFGSVSQSTFVGIRDEGSPVWNSWWMITIYCTAGLVVILLSLLVCVLCKEFCITSDTKDLNQPKKRRIDSIGMMSIVSDTPAWSEGVSTRRTTLPSAMDTTLTESYPSTDKTLETAPGVDGSSPQSNNSAANRPFGVEVVTSGTFMRPLSWHEYWLRQQQTSSGSPSKVGFLHPVRRHTFNDSNHSSHFSDVVHKGSASPSKRKGQSKNRSDKIRKSEGKGFNDPQGSNHKLGDSPPLDLTLQLVECDEEELVVNPSMFDLRSRGSIEQKQTEDAFAFLEDYDVTDKTSRLEDRGSHDLQESNSMLGNSPSLDLHSRDSNEEKQTQEAFAFLEDYDVTSQGTGDVDIRSDLDVEETKHVNQTD